VPEKLPVEVLEQNRPPRLADSNHFSDGALFLPQVFEQHAAINYVETFRRKLQRLRVSTDETRSRVIAIFPRRFPDAIGADIYAGSANRRILGTNCPQDHARPTADRENVHAPSEVMSHVFLNPSLRIEFRFQPRGLTRVVHDVINCCGLDHCLP
jgi:hypothetical protein